MKNSKQKNKYKYDWQPDLPDLRDYRFAEKIKSPSSTLLPLRTDLRDQCPPIVNQAQIGSCTANALAGLMGVLEKQGVTPETFIPHHFSPFSRLFIYYNERSLEGRVNEDSGAQLRDGIKSLSEWGACKEETWKYSENHVCEKPDASAYLEASEHRISIYSRLSNLNEMKECLADGFPFVFGFLVYESFESAEFAKTGIMPIPTKNEQLLGGHAVMAVGYDDTKKYLIVRNSWGTDWGANGYFYMPYEVIQTLHLARDFWTIRK